jgi:hypothetical protein
MIEQVERAVFRIEKTHQPDHMEGGGAHFLADDPAAVLPAQRGLEIPEFGDEVIVAEEIAITAADGDESGGVEPALDRLIAHAVRAEIPIEHRAGLAHRRAEGFIRKPGFPLDEQHQPDELHAEALVVVDHEMIRLAVEIADAVADQPRG